MSSPGLGFGRACPSTDLEQLVKRAQGGDRAAFSDVVRAVTQQIANLVYRLGVPICDIDDVTPHVLINAWRSLPRFRFDSTFRTWIYKVTCNTVVDHHRGAAHRGLAETVAFDNRHRVHRDPVAEFVMDLDQQNEILALLDQLSVEHRDALVLDAEGLTDREAADILGISPKAFSSRVARARRSMRRVLSDRPQEFGR